METLLNWVAIRTLLRRRGIRSWDELARLAGMPRQRLYALRSGRNPNPRVATVMAIAKALECEVGQCLNWDSMDINEIEDLESQADDQLT